MRKAPPKPKKPKKGFTEGYKTYDASNGHGNAKEWKQNFYDRMSSDEAKVIIDSQPGSPYFILGVNESASPAEIKAAFRSKLKQWHPDLNPDNIQEATEKTKSIIAAYTILTEDYTDIRSFLRRKRR